MVQNKTLVLYHANCLDGFASAWIVGNWFGFGNVEMQAVEYGQPVPDITNRDVYIVDFSYPPAVLLPVLHTSKCVIMLDHHKGAADMWNGNWAMAFAGEEEQFAKLVTVFDKSKSGVGVVWDFFHSNLDEAENYPLPKLLQYVQDYDLYKHVYPESRLIQAALMNGRLAQKDAHANFQYFGDQVQNFDKNQGQALLEMGTVILESHRHLAQALLKRNSMVVSFMGVNVPLANIPYELRDIAGEIMYEDQPFSVTYEDRHAEGIRKFSLRSCPFRGADVLVIAEAMGGSGHEHSAGFVLPLTNNILPETSRG